MTMSRDSETPQPGASPMGRVQAQADAIFKAQGDALRQIDTIQKSWFECLRSGVDSAGSFAARVAKVSNPSEAAELYREWLDHRLESITEDGKRFAKQWHAMCQTSMKSFYNSMQNGDGAAQADPPKTAAERRATAN